MTTESTRPLKLFYCYAREDKALRDELDIHLNSLKRQNLVTSWYDGAIGPGTEWEKEIDTQLRNADIILLLVTPHFMASDYCYDIEMKRALERHRRGTVRIIPIILRRTFLNDAPFRSLQILPTDAKPVTQWPDRDAIAKNQCFLDLTDPGIDRLAENARIRRVPSLQSTARRLMGQLALRNTATPDKYQRDRRARWHKRPSTQA